MKFSREEDAASLYSVGYMRGLDMSESYDQRAMLRFDERVLGEEQIQAVADCYLSGIECA